MAGDAEGWYISWTLFLCFLPCVGSPIRSHPSRHTAPFRRTPQTTSCSVLDSLLPSNLSHPQFHLPLPHLRIVNAWSTSRPPALFVGHQSSGVPSRRLASPRSPQRPGYVLFVISRETSLTFQQHYTLSSPIMLQKQKAQMTSMGYSNLFNLGYLSATVSLFHLFPPGPQMNCIHFDPRAPSNFRARPESALRIPESLRTLEHSALLIMLRSMYFN